MSRSRRELGRFGESLAADRLEAAGWSIVERNWRCARGEVDIVAREGDCLVVVEVRTRSSRLMGTAEESIVPRKRVRLARLANTYVHDTGWQGPCRIDVITVYVDRDARRPVVRHYRNAVSGEWA